MSDQEILDILLEFKDFLSQGWIVMDVFRSLGWIIILGLGWLVDSLESVTDSILGLKTFFSDSGITGFIDVLRPLSVILMAFSLLYTGYLIIFQKKVDREAVIVNVFLALVVITLLGTGLEQANKFTDEAVTALKGEEKGSLANTVVKDGILDIALYDLQGWDTPEIDPENNIPEKNIRDIDINAYLTDGTKITKDKELSNEGVDILSQKLDTLGDGSHGLIELDDGNFITDITKEYYYRYSVDWFTIMVTLAITAFTLLTIAIKLAKLFFELTFNYVLATIIAPADIHSGQKTKQVVQNILNIFLVTIMIFLSMKIYLMGTAFIDEKLTGLPYLIALFAFSLAVIDGPNIVERLFGIDAGLKSGWGALAGAYAGGKGISKGLKGLSSAGKSASLKGLGGAAGVAGLAQGLKKDKNEGQGQEGKNDQNKLQDEKGNGNSQSNGNEMKNGKDENENKNVAENGAENSEEVNAGKNEAASSLEQEMSHQEQKEQEGSRQGQGLHEEMASQGTGGTSATNAIVSNSGGLNTSGGSTGGGSNVSEQVSSGSSISGGSGSSGSSSNHESMNVSQQVGISNSDGGQNVNVSEQVSVGSSGSGGSTGGGTVSEQVSGGSSFSGGSTFVNEQVSSGSTGGSPNVSEQSSSGSVGNVNSSSYVPSNSNTNIPTPIPVPVPSGNNSNTHNVTGRTTTETARETRHVGNVVSDNFRNNRTVQRVQRSYDIGRNTGQNVRGKISNYRNKFNRGNRSE